MCCIELLLIKMQVFDLRSKTVLIWDQNPKDLDLVFHWVSRFIHLTQIDLINWLVTLWIINEFENVHFITVPILRPNSRCSNFGLPTKMARDRLMTELGVEFELSLS